MKIEANGSGGAEPKFDRSSAIAAIEEQIIKTLPEEIKAATEAGRTGWRHEQDSRVEMFKDLSDILPSALDDAIETIRQEKDEYRRDKLFKTLVPTFVEAGRVPELLQMTKSEIHRHDLIELACVCMGQRGDSEEALALAKSISAPWRRIQALTSLGSACPILVRRVYATINQIKAESVSDSVDSSKQKAFIAFAPYIPAAGRRAARNLQETDRHYPDQDARIWIQLAKTFPEYTHQALEAATTPEEPSRYAGYGQEARERAQESKYQLISRALEPVEEAIRNGDTTAALAFIAPVQDKLPQRVLQDLYDSFVENGDPVNALAMASKMPDDLPKIIRELAPDLAEAGQGEALVIAALTLPSGIKKVELLGWLSQFEPSALPVALEVAQHTIHESHSIEALKSLIQYDSDIIKATEEEIERQIKEGDHHTKWSAKQSKIGLCKTVARLGHIDEALRLSDSTEQDEEFRLGLIASSPRLSDEYVEELKLKVDSLPDSKKKSVVLAEAAKHIPELGDKAVELASGQIQASADRSSYYTHETIQEAYGVINPLLQAEFDDQVLILLESVPYASVHASTLTELARRHPELATRAIDNAIISDQVEKTLAALAPENSEVYAIYLKLVQEEPRGQEALLKKLAPDIIAAGKSSELAETVAALAGEGSSYGYTHLPEAIAPLLLANGELEAANRVMEAIAPDYSIHKAKAMADVLTTYPDLAPRIYAEVKETPFSRTKVKILQQLAPLLPEAHEEVIRTMKSMDSLESWQWSKYDYPQRAADKTAMLESFLEAKDFDSAFNIINKTGEKTNSGELIARHADSIFDANLSGKAIQISRALSPEQKAVALAGLYRAQQSSSERDSSVWNELAGVPLDPNDENSYTDRSINARYFQPEMADNPLILEALMHQARTPAQMLALLDVYDESQADKPDAVQSKLLALHMVARFGKAEQFTQQWKADRQQQALGGTKADAELFRHLPNVRQLSDRLRASGGTAKVLLEQGFETRDLLENPWLINDSIAKLANADIITGEDAEAAKNESKKLYPVRGSKVEQYEWLADHSLVAMPGYSRRAIGQIISNRLSNNLEGSLHDATQWLTSFAIQSTVNQLGIDPETGERNVESVMLFDADAEQEFLASILHGTFDEQQLRRLPGFSSASGSLSDIKTQKFEGLFHDTGHAVLYASMLQELAQGDGQKIDRTSLERRLAEWSEDDLIPSWLGQSKNISSLNPQATIRSAQELAATLAKPADLDGKPTTERLASLRELEATRKHYVDDATRWIKQYQNLSGDKLKRAWEERPHALAEGVGDTPAEIYTWSMSSALRTYFRNNTDAQGNLPSGINYRALMSRYDQFVPELSTRYSSEKIAKTLERLWSSHDTEADLPSCEVELNDGNVFKIFSKEDPAGLTIGHDTNCCMTLGGASESCIFAGYEDPRFGFAGLYDNNGKLLAQSFIWHNQGTLVLDNIEAQRGHSLEKVQTSYRAGLTAYLTKMATVKPDLQLRDVNIGTGYMEAELARGLSHTNPVPIPSTGSYLYSDARSQLKLITLDDQDIEAFQDNPLVTQMKFDEAVSAEVQKPDNTPEFITVKDAGNGAEIIGMLEQQIYPEELQSGEPYMSSALSRPNNYSFLIGSRSGNGSIAGYMVAYGTGPQSAYVDDLAILPTEQRKGYGVDAFGYFLDTMLREGITDIEVEARERTSYQAMQTPAIQALLAEKGYRIGSEVKRQGFYDNGESAYSIRLERLPVSA